MTTRVLLERAFVLHHRPYRSSSLIVELLSSRYGRVAAVARSARGHRSRYRGYLQIFSPLLISWGGRRELMNIVQVELDGLPFQLSGQALLCAFYLNELLLRLLSRDDPYPEVFIEYQTALQNMMEAQSLPPILRRFEKRLLEYLGYGLPLKHDVSNAPIHPQNAYQWLPDQGFLRCSASSGEHIFSGRELIALQTEKWDTPGDLTAAKRLMRLALGRHLGNKPLKSRELFSHSR